MPPPTDDLPELADLFDPTLLSERQEQELEQRLRRLHRQVRRLGTELRRVERPASHPPAPGSDAPREETLLRAIAEGIRAASRPELKTRVLDRFLDTLGRHYLWRNLSSLPGWHELTVLGPWHGGNLLQGGPLHEAMDRLVGQILFGLVIPLDRVRRDLLSSRAVYLGHCACRSAGVVDDRSAPLLLPPAEQRLLLDRILDRYRALGPDRIRRTTDPRYRALFEELDGARRRGSAACRLDVLLDRTWPDWEILPVLPGYTTRWLRSMRNNRKAHRLDRELAFELAGIQFHARGIVFNSMIAVDTPYTICACPGPEADGGCVLTNWYYHGRVNRALVPAEGAHGRRRDAEGQLLGCRWFPVRHRRQCLGCGCFHDTDTPRDLHRSLAEADAMLARARNAEPERPGPA